MSAAEVQALLTALPAHTGILATVRADGRPNAAPVWFDVVDDGSAVFTTNATTRKARYLTCSTWAPMCVNDERPPFAWAVLEGPDELFEDLAEVTCWATRLGGPYMGPEACGHRNEVPGEVLVRLCPERVLSAADLAD